MTRFVTRVLIGEGILADQNPWRKKFIFANYEFINYVGEMNFNDFLKQEWVPALGCTEPASISYAGLNAANQLEGPVTSARLSVDPRIYKNCHAVGIPHSGHKTGIKWATALGCFLKDKKLKLQCFKEINDEIIKSAKELIDSKNIHISINKSKTNLYIDFQVSDGVNGARCIIEDQHTNITLIEKNNNVVFEEELNSSIKIGNAARKWASSLSIAEIIDIVKNIGDESREKIRRGLYLNLRIAEHGLTLFPKPFVEMLESDSLTKIAGLVCAGVYARMWGEDFPVMSVAGSGNKGIVTAVPINRLENEWKLNTKRVEEAMALAILFTSKTTEELGTLSAVCGCSNAAGIGLACALVYMKGGGEKEISFAINNMVGNVTGMICDGAKIGCALKTMTSVDAAFRAMILAMNGIGIPPVDGIVGINGSDSLVNMGKIAKDGMIQTDEEILKIMEKKL